MELWVSIFALLISAVLGGASLLITVLGNKRTARRTETQELRNRLEECERKCRECEAARKHQEKEKLNLLLENRDLRRASGG